MNQLQGQSSTNATSDGRVERIRETAAKLLDSTVLNTKKSRATCRELAVAMIQLLDDEDAFHDSRPAPAFEEDNEAMHRLAEALRACRETGEQEELLVSMAPGNACKQENRSAD